MQQATRQGCRSFTQKSAEKCGSDPQGGKDGVHVVRAAERRQLHPASSALCAESGINFGGFTEALQEARGEPPRKTGGRVCQVASVCCGEGVGEIREVRV